MARVLAQSLWQALRRLSHNPSVLSLSGATILLNPPLHAHDRLRLFVGAGLVALAFLEAVQEDDDAA